MGVTLPADYLRIVQTSDSVEEMLPNAYFVLWSLDEVVDINVRDTYGLQQTIPGLLLIGGDGGGELLAFDMREEPAAVVLVNAIGSSWDEVSRQAASWSELLAALRAGGSYTFT